MNQQLRRSTDRLDSALMESNALLRRVIDENPSIILMKDWYGKFLLGNRALATLYGTNPEDLVGKDDGAFNPNAEQVAFYLKNVREIMSQNVTQVVMEESTDTVTGETKFYQSIKIPLTTSDGKKQILVIANDVSELKRTQQRLEESERRLSYVLDATGEGIWDWNIVNDTITHNKTWCRVIGFDDGYLQHSLQVFSDLIHPDDKGMVMAKLEASLSGDGRYQSEHRLKLRNGQEIWVLDRGRVVEHDARGNPTRMVGSFVDISERKVTEYAAAHAANLLRESVETIAQGFTIYDEQDRLYLCNEAYKRIYRLSQDLIVPGNTFESIVRQGAQRGQYAEAIGDVDAWVKKRVAQHQNANGEVMEQRLADGRWLLIVESRTPSGFIVGNRIDITELKNTTLALNQSEQRWELALSSINDGLWDWNPKTGEVYFSSRWKSMLGYRDDEIAATIDEWIQRVHPDDVEATMAEVQRHLRGETEYYQSEHRLRCKDGSYKWILDRGRVYIDINGNPVRMLGSHSDITERREAQERERMHAEQLAAIFEFSPDGYVTFDSNRNVKYVSPAFTSLSGLAASDIQGVSELTFSEKLAEVCLVTARFQGIASMRGISSTFDFNGAVQGDRPCGKEGQGTRQVIEMANIANRVLEVALRETQSDHVSQILHLRDISYETEVDRLKTEFLSTAAHELRTPMASIYGFSEVLIKQEVSQSERQEFLGIIHRQSELMGGILNELLDLARIEARKGKDFAVETVEVQSFVGEVISNFKLPANRSSPQISAPTVSLFIRADRKKSAQAILNVISNAYKYSQPGEKVQIMIEQVGKNVTICVIDQGIGMTSDQVRHVGERFYRANLSGSVSGTGLGMSIVTEIMKMHGGSVSIQSAPGKGSAFKLTFPMALI